MSNPLKSIGKIFKKVVKVVMKVAPFALAAAAVIFTGGAALGLPFAAGGFSAAMGSVVSAIGISGPIAGILGGALTGAGMGAAVGGILGGKKGLKAGFLTGAVTGGFMGALNPGMTGVMKNPTTGAWTTKGAWAASQAGNTAAASSTGAVSGGGGLAPSPIAPGAAPVTPLTAGGGSGFQPLTSLAPSNAGSSLGGYNFSQYVGNGGGATGVGSGAAAGGGGGIGGFFGQNPGLAGQLLQTVGGVLGGGGEGDAERKLMKQKYEEERKMAEFAYGGVYAGRDNPFGVQPYAPPPPGRWRYNPATNAVEEVPI